MNFKSPFSVCDYEREEKKSFSPGIFHIQAVKCVQYATTCHLSEREREIDGNERGKIRKILIIILIFNFKI
jgi:hypothetical protein